MFLGTITILLIYIGVIVAAVIAERYFIKRRKKWELVLPAVVLIIGIIGSVNAPFITSMGGGGLQRHDITDGNDNTLGSFYVLEDIDREIKGVGQLIVGEGENAQVYDMEIEDNTVIGGEEALRYKEEIEEMFGYSEGEAFTGKSMVYGELQKLEKEIITEKQWHTPYTYLMNLIIYYGPGIALFAMYITSRISRKRRNRMKKAKLEEL